MASIFIDPNTHVVITREEYNELCAIRDVAVEIADSSKPSKPKPKGHD